MTKFKTALAAVTIASFAVVAFAYTTKSKKPTTNTTFYFDENSGLTRGPINGTQTLIQSEVKDSNNWITIGQNCNGGNYLCGLVFNFETVSDGISDGQYSLQEVLQEVWNEYTRNSQYTLPAHGNSFTPPVSGASSIIILRALTN